MSLFRSRGERRGESSLSSLSYSCLGQARQEEEEEEYGGFGEGRGARSRERLSRNLSMSHESVFQMEPLPSQVQRTVTVIRMMTESSPQSGGLWLGSRALPGAL